MEQDKKVWTWVFAAVAMLLLFGSFGMGGYGMMGFGMGFGFLFMILFWGVVVWLVISFINAAQSNKKDGDASTILKKRLPTFTTSKSPINSLVSLSFASP